MSPEKSKPDISDNKSLNDVNATKMTSFQQSVKEWKNGETTRFKNFKELRRKLSI